MRHFAAGGEPDAFVRLHVRDDVRQGFRSAGPAGNVRMKLERTKRRRETGLFIKLIEHALPDRQRVAGIARIAVTVSTPVAERLARQLDESFLTVLP